MNIKELLGMSRSDAESAFVHSAGPYIIPGKPKLFARELVRLQVEACDLYRAARWTMHHLDPQSPDAIELVIEMQRAAAARSRLERSLRGVE